jgi:O-antigen ligase
MTALAAWRSLPAPTLRMALQTALFAVGLMWLLPFLVPFKAPPLPSFHAEALAFALGLVALLTLPAWLAKLPVPRVTVLPAAFVVLILLQIALGRLAYAQQGLLGALYLLWAAALMVLAALLRRELGLERVAAVLAWFLFAGLIACSIIGLAQYLGSYAFLGRYITIGSGSRVWGNLAQPNHLADYMSLGLASLAFLFATGRLRLVYALFAGVFSLYILSLTGSRAPWLYLTAFGVLAAVFFAAERSVVNRRLLLVCLLVLAGLYLVPLAISALQPAAVPAPITAAERLAKTFANEKTFATEQRTAISHAAWLIFLHAPVLGAGFRQFGVEHFLVNAQLPAPRVPGFTDNAHNLVLHAMAEFGAVGLLALLAGLAAWLTGVRRQPRTAAFWWVLALASVVGIHSMLEFPLWYAFFLGVAAVVLGLGEHRTLEWSAANGRLRRMRLAFWSILLLGGLVFVQVVRDYLLLENFLAFRYRYLHASAELNRQAKDMLLELHRSSLLSPWVELGLARTIHVSADGLADKLAVNTRAMRAFPVDDVVYRQAMLLALAGEEEQARKQWEQAAASYPGLRRTALLVLRRRVEDGMSGLAPLLAYAERMN